MTAACVFCDRIAAGQYDRGWPDAVAFPPRAPVVPGHLLVVPRAHVADVGTDPAASAAAMRAAAELVAGDRARAGDFNVITSAGPAATQTVYHLHLHVVPRRVGDGLALPWTGAR